MDFTKQKAIRLVYLIFFLFGVSSTIINPLIPWISENLYIGYDKIGLILLISSLFGVISTAAAGKLCDTWDIKNIILVLFIINSKPDNTQYLEVSGAVSDSSEWTIEQGINIL